MDSPTTLPEVTALVLCGGTSRRFGGGDKTAAPLGDGTVLSRLMLGLPRHWPVVAVGEPRVLPCEVCWTVEDPPRGGPLAGMAAGLAEVRTPYVVVIAGDQPFAGDVAPLLVETLRRDGTVEVVAAMSHGAGVDERSDGRPQLLLAAYRVAALRAALPVDARDRGVHSALSGLRVVTVKLPEHATWDVDTRADLARAHRKAAELPGAPTASMPGAVDR